MVDKSEYIKRLKEAYQKKNNKTLSDEEALAFFEEIIAILQIIYRPIDIYKKSK